jgi:hypothetical protein
MLVSGFDIRISDFHHPVVYRRSSAFICGSKLFLWLSSLWLRDEIRQGIVRTICAFLAVAMFRSPPAAFRAAERTSRCTLALMNETT